MASLLSAPGPHGRVMITNNGPHPPDVWAQASAEHICPIGPDVTGERRIAALVLQAAIQTALEKHHAQVMQDEKSKLVANPARMLEAVDGADYTNDAMAAIQVAAHGTDWEAHFVDPAVHDQVLTELERHFSTVQHIERSWHADKNAHLPEAAQFRAMHHTAA